MYDPEHEEHASTNTSAGSDTSTGLTAAWLNTPGDAFIDGRSLCADLLLATGWRYHARARVWTRAGTRVPLVQVQTHLTRVGPVRTVEDMNRLAQREAHARLWAS